METVSSEYDESAAHFRVSEIPALVVVWSREEPERVGEVLLPAPDGMPRGGWVFGRGDEGRDRLTLVRQRPAENQPTEALRSSRISREQLRIRCGEADSLMLENIGRRSLVVDGQGVGKARVREGSLVELRNELTLLVARRPVELPHFGLPPELMPAFGRADDFGIVGESPPAWALRGRIWFAAQRDVHVLIGGPSGVGKELVAQAIHALSARGRRALVSRNAATFPETLIDAELFGNIRDYPNPGMPERPGLIGSADKTSLFLDEIGELSHELQAHLLRVLDQGEYQRLGDSKPLRADLRLIAATNRSIDQLKHDFAARFRLQVDVPGLDQRREDIPLLIVHLLRRLAADDPGLARRFFVEGDAARGSARIDPIMVRQLLGRGYRTHVRELDGLLWSALMHSVVEGREQVGLESSGVEPVADVDPTSLGAEQIAAALEQAQGVQDRAWRILGLRNRFQLIRLIKKHNLQER